MVSIGPFCVLLAAIWRAALASTESEDLTALVQLDVQTRLGAERSAVVDTANKKQESAQYSNASSVSNTSSMSNASSTVNISNTWDISHAPPALVQAIKEAAAAAQQPGNASFDSAALARQLAQGAHHTTGSNHWVHNFEVDMSFRHQLEDLYPHFLTTCIQRGFTSDEDCRMADDVLRTLIASLWGITDEWVLNAVRNRLALTWFLWAPGPPMSLLFPDTNHDDNLDWDELNHAFGVFVMTNLLPLRIYLDPDSDGNTTRGEIYNYIRSGILIRDQLRKVDGFYPEASTSYCLRHAHKFFYRPHIEYHLNRLVKAAFLIGIALVTACFIAWAECGYMRRK